MSAREEATERNLGVTIDMHARQVAENERLTQALEAAERRAAAYRVALEQIAAWDTKGGKLLGYEGPRAVARAALASPIEETK